MIHPVSLIQINSHEKLLCYLTLGLQSLTKLPVNYHFVVFFVLIHFPNGFVELGNVEYFMRKCDESGCTMIGKVDKYVIIWTRRDYLSSTKMCDHFGPNAFTFHQQKHAIIWARQVYLSSTKTCNHSFFSDRPCTWLCSVCSIHFSRLEIKILSVLILFMCSIYFLS